MNYHRWVIILADGERREGEDNFPPDDLKARALEIQLETTSTRERVRVFIPTGAKAVLIRKNRVIFGTNMEPLGAEPTYIIGYELNGVRKTEEVRG